MSDRSANRRAASTVAMIYVNDEPRPLGSDSSVAALVRELGLAERKGVAVAINGAVVPRAQWPTHVLIGGERVLVIRATQGG